MKFIASTIAFVARYVMLGLAVAFVVTLLWPEAGSALRGYLHGDGNGTGSRMATTAPAHADIPRTGVVSYADAVKRAAPSVVNIYANKVVAERQSLPKALQQLFGNVPVGPTRLRREQSLGSGVIVDPSGYVLTNNHVIANARNIQVLLYDGRVAQAKVVGADPTTDLAVLKVDAGKLPAIPMANHPVHVGDIVMAIGNPLGIGQTVTMGIVSALGRQLDPNNLESFIQTDAAINFGNSGGALVNALGQLIGINTALLGHAAGAEGISFAIPLSTAQYVMQQIIATGHVTRSWLGILYSRIPVRPGSTQPAHKGVMVTAVYPGGPAGQVGIRAGDILLKIDDHVIVDPENMYQRVSTIKPGTTVTLQGLRDGSTFTISTQVQPRPQPATADTNPPAS